MSKGYQSELMSQCIYIYIYINVGQNNMQKFIHNFLFIVKLLKTSDNFLFWPMKFRLSGLLKQIILCVTAFTPILHLC